MFTNQRSKQAAAFCAGAFVFHLSSPYEWT
jgi:hypothetical protein